MAYVELQQALETVIARGDLGTPVALRISRTHGPEALDPPVEFARLMSLVAAVFPDPPQTVMVQRHDSGWLTSLLMNLAGGQTVSLSVSHGEAPQDLLTLVLVGNHGTARLEGGDELEWSTTGAQDGEETVAAVAGADIDRWRTLIDSSLRQGAPVAF